MKHPIYEEQIDHLRSRVRIHTEAMTAQVLSHVEYARLVGVVSAYQSMLNQVEHDYDVWRDAQ